MHEQYVDTKASLWLPARRRRLFAGALLFVAVLLTQACVPANAPPGATVWPFFANTGSSLQVATGSNVLTQVGGSISGTFRAFPLGDGVFKSDPTVTGATNFAYDAAHDLYTFDYHIRGVSNVANGDQLGWEGDGRGTYTKGCMTSATDCSVRIDVTYDRLFGTGRYADASGLIGEVIEVVWQSTSEETTTFDVRTQLNGWIAY